MASLKGEWLSLTDHVRYHEEYDLGRAMLESTTMRQGDSIIESALERLVRDVKILLFSKLADFRDEREWRVAIAPTEKNISPMSEFLFPFGDSLQAVID